MVLLFTALTAPHAVAQSQGRLAVGAGFSTKQPSLGGAEGTIGPALLWRWGHNREGWQFKYGLNWFSTELDGIVDGQATPLGKLHVRPLMGGYGYTRALGRVTVSANMMAGYAFSSFSINSAATDMYRSRLGVSDVDTDASNTLVLKPELSTWIDLTERIGLNVNVGYMFARPQVTIRSSAGEEQRRIRADTFMFKMGVVYSVF